MTASYEHCRPHRRQSWGVATPQNLGRGVVGGVAGGSWTGRKILLYLIMHRKYVRKWWLLKINRIICPEIAVNSQFLPGKSIFFGNLPLKLGILYKITFKKMEIFRKFALKNRFFVKLPETKSKFLGNFPRKSIFLWNCLKIEILLKCALKNRFF